MARRFVVALLACLSGCDGEGVGELDVVPPAEWSASFDSSWDDRVVIAADRDDGLVLAGSFGDEVDVGGVRLVSAGRTDVVVARFDRDGIVRWARGFGGEMDDEATAVAVAPTGEVYAAGRFHGSIDFGGGGLQDAGSVDLGDRPIAGHDGDDLFIVALDADGDHMWSRRFGVICVYDPDYDACFGTEDVGGVAVRPTGGVCVSASAEGALDLGDLDGRPIEPWDSAFVACFDRDARVDWLAPLTDGSRAATIGVDGAGNVHVLSYVDAGGFEVDVFDAQGSRLRSDSYTHGGGVFDAALAVRADGSHFVTGSFHGQLDLHEVVLDTNSPPPRNGISTDRHAFVASFMPDGALSWARDDGAAVESHASGMAVVPFGADGVVVGGYYEEPFDFGGGALPDAEGNTTNLFFAGFDATGQHVWSMGSDALGFDFVTALSATPRGRLCFAASFGERLTLPTGTHVGHQAQAAAFGCMRAPRP